MDVSDQQLLRDYAVKGDELAFSELVRRHVDFVFSAALRMVRDAHLAEDVTQAVFAALARDAARLADRPTLGGWLHRTAQNLAAQTVRSDVRRRAREQEAATMNEIFADAPDANWDRIAPHLDAALGELKETDREALLLRYFQRKSAREIALIFTVSEEAAQKRVNRALERLRDLFARRGIAIGPGAVAALLSANAVQSAPAGLAATASAIKGLAALSGTAAGLTHVITMTTLQKTLIAAVVAAGIGTGLYQARRASQLESQIAALEEERAGIADRLEQLQAERDGVFHQQLAMTQTAVNSRVITSDTNNGSSTPLSLIEELRLCLQEPSDEERRRKFSSLLNRMGPGDTREFFAVLSEARKNAGLHYEWEAFWRRRSEVDPFQALADLNVLMQKVRRDASGQLILTPEDRELLHVYGQFFSAWASADFQAARDWFATHPDDPNRGVALAGFLNSYAAKDLAGATDFLLAAGSPGTREFSIASQIVCNQALQQHNTAAATQWFDQLPTDGTGVSLRQIAVAEIAGRLTEQNLPAARAWVGDQADKPWRDYQSINMVANRFSAEDPAAAMNWITGLAPDPGNGSITGIGAVVRNWSTSDPAGLQQWLEANQPSGSRAFAQAAGECAVLLAPTDYNQAMLWLNQIPATFPNVRQNFQRMVEAAAAPKPTGN